MPCTARGGGDSRSAHGRMCVRTPSPPQSLQGTARHRPDPPHRHAVDAHAVGRLARADLVQQHPKGENVGLVGAAVERENLGGCVREGAADCEGQAVGGCVGGVRGCGWAMGGRRAGLARSAQGSTAGSARAHSGCRCQCSCERRAATAPGPRPPAWRAHCPSAARSAQGGTSRVMGWCCWFEARRVPRRHPAPTRSSTHRALDVHVHYALGVQEDKSACHIQRILPAAMDMRGWGGREMRQRWSERAGLGWVRRAALSHPRQPRRAVAGELAPPPSRTRAPSPLRSARGAPARASLRGQAPLPAGSPSAARRRLGEGKGGGGGDDARCRRGGGWPRSSGRHVPLTAKSVGSGARTRPRPHALRNCTRHSCWHCRRMSDSLTSASVPDFAASSRLSTLMATGVPSGSSPSYTWGGGGPGRSREGLVRGGAARGTAT